MSSCYILALETSTLQTSVALYDKGQLIGASMYHCRKSHSELLPTMIRQVMEVAQVPPQALQAVGIGTGPGSYTGLRIGAAVAKGICLGQDIPLLGIDTLTILMDSVTFAMPFDYSCGLLKAGPKRAYVALRDAKGVSVVDKQVITMEASFFRPWVEKGRVLFLGSGADLHSDWLHSLGQVSVAMGCYPVARVMGKRLYSAFLKGEFLDMDHFYPHYLSEKWDRP